MQFKIKNTTYKISFTFFALLLYAVTMSENRVVLFLLLSAVLHELVHLVFIFIFSVPPETVSLNLLGANIKREISTSFNANSEIIINASAPVFNIITGVVFYCLTSLSVNSQKTLSEISQVNLFLGFFNLIPFYTFDGGNVIKYVLLKSFSERITEQLITSVSLIVTVVFSFISIHIFLNYQHNFSLIIMCIYIFLSIIFKKKNSLDY